MVDNQRLEECINEAMENGDMELLDLLLKLRDSSNPFNNDTENVSSEKKETVEGVNINAIAEYFQKRSD